MKLHCASCNLELTKDIQLNAPEDAYNTIRDEDEWLKYEIRPGACVKQESSFIVSEHDLTGAKITNAEKGCCNFDHFEIECGCGLRVGWGKNDCWQDDMCFIDDKKVSEKKYL